MAFDQTPWFVGGGALHSPEVARALAYVATNGAEGVAGVGDLKVTAQPVPNGSVRMNPGGGLLLNRYPGGTGQSYSARNATATDIPITATGSGGGRTDLIVARVLDPQYEGSAPSDPTTFEYALPQVIPGVSASATVKSLNLQYPAINIARVTLPPNTATVTPGMITDLRRVARPRRETAKDSAFWQDSIVNITTGPPNWQYFGRSTDLYVPAWATAAKVTIMFGGVGITGGPSQGWLRGKFGTGSGGVEMRATYWDENPVSTATDKYERGTYVVASEFQIPAAMRDTTQYIELQGQRVNGTGYLQMRYGTSVGFDVEFSEVAY